MARKISGVIKNITNQQPLEGVLVQAFDADPGADELMGSDYTDENGRYKIIYPTIEERGRKWDWSLGHGHTIWRPDIYIRVKMLTNVGWVKVYESTVFGDWRTRHDLTINATVSVPHPDSRTIFIEVLDKNTQQPINMANIEVFDKDNPPFDPHDFMVSGITDSQGKSKLIYPGRKWDNDMGSSRFPDISIRVKAPEKEKWIGNFPNHNPREPLYVTVEMKEHIPVEQPNNGSDSSDSGTDSSTGQGTIVYLANISGETRYIYKNGQYIGAVPHGYYFTIVVQCNEIVLIQAKDKQSDVYNDVTFDLNLRGLCGNVPFEIVYDLYS